MANASGNQYVQVLRDDDIPVEFLGSYTLGGPFEAAAIKFHRWCQVNRVFYYARPREHFNSAEAFRKARAAGCDKLILEDLS